MSSVPDDTGSQTQTHAVRIMGYNDLILNVPIMQHNLIGLLLYICLDYGPFVYKFSSNIIWCYKLYKI